MSLIVQVVQWHNGAAVRSGRLFDVTKLHMTVGGVTTLCGRRIPRRSQQLIPDMKRDEFCKQCEAVKRKREEEM